jgi:hypothetical protein
MEFVRGIRVDVAGMSYIKIPAPDGNALKRFRDRESGVLMVLKDYGLNFFFPKASLSNEGPAQKCNAP